MYDIIYSVKYNTGSKCGNQKEPQTLREGSAIPSSKLMIVFDDANGDDHG